MSKITARKPNRLKEYDYSKVGYYYVTICTYNREALFGRIHEGKMVLNNAGRMINTIFHDLSQHVRSISIDQYVVMPNHIHGIINIVGVDPRVDPNQYVCPLQNNKLSNNGQAQRHCIGQAQRPVPTDKLSLSDIIHRFKTITTKKYIDGVNNDNWPPFNKQLWQRSFYDHVIRTDESLNNIREYIIANATKWDEDENNIKNYKLQEK